MIIFVLYNIILDSLMVSGMLYHVYMMLLIIINVIVLIKFRKEIRFKSLAIIIYAITWLFSKDFFQYLFNSSNIIILCAIGFKDSNLIKLITILLTLFVFNFFGLLFGCFLIFLVVKSDGARTDIMGQWMDFIIA